MKSIEIICGDALIELRKLETGSIDLLCCDPPYGIGFMGKDWDKTLPDKAIWAECLRVLKAGAFAFVMSIPRADCLSRMIISLEDAGFNVGFSPIYWAYASGFPKAQNIGKAVDKRLGAEREVVGVKDLKRGSPIALQTTETSVTEWNKRDYPDKVKITNPATSQAKALDGSYAGFQPKPAVEVILVAMKPLSEKTYVDQALKNRKGITWLDDARIPYESEGDVGNWEEWRKRKAGMILHNTTYQIANKPESLPVQPRELPNRRFPANLLVSDDVLNDGRNRKTGNVKPHQRHSISQVIKYNPDNITGIHQGDSGSFSRYFDLDKFFENLLDKLKSKACNKEKNVGDTQWEVSQAEDELGLRNKTIPANGVVENSSTMPVTEPSNITSAQKPAVPNIDLANQSLDAKSVAEKLDYTETDIVQRFAQIKQDTETLLETITENSEIPIGQKQHSLLSQSVVNYVVSKLQDLRDIIQTIINQPRLFGFALPAIIEQMRQDLSQDQLWQNFWQEQSALLTESQQQTYPFAVISKASKSEKNKGLEGKKLPVAERAGRDNTMNSKYTLDGKPQSISPPERNSHPTTKPIKLMSYLITLGSRQGDTVLDPFLGSGTTALACKLLGRKCVGIEIEEKYCEIAANRCRQSVLNLNI